jgi:hypothetical protein
MLHSSSGQEAGFSTREREFDSPMQRHGLVAQLDRAPRFERGGPGFDSSRDRHSSGCSLVRRKRVPRAHEIACSNHATLTIKSRTDAQDPVSLVDFDAVASVREQRGLAQSVEQRTLTPRAAVRSRHPPPNSGAVAKWERRGLQNRYEPVRSWPAPPCFRSSADRAPVFYTGSPGVRILSEAPRFLRARFLALRNRL